MSHLNGTILLAIFSIFILGMNPAKAKSYPRCGSSQGKFSVSAPKQNLCSKGYVKVSPYQVGSNWLWSCSTGSLSNNCFGLRPAPLCRPNSSLYCPVANGTGKKSCNAIGSAWGSCVIATCKAGYTQVKGACVKTLEASLPPRNPNNTPYSLTISDPMNLLGNDRAGVMANFHAAILDWSRWIKSKGVLRIKLEITNNANSPGSRFSARSYANRYHSFWNGHYIFEESATYKMRTGQSIPGTPFDGVIQANVDFMRKFYWIDPRPFVRSTRVPLGKTDLVTVFAHELGHVFGMNGWLSTENGSAPANKGISLYDKLILSSSMNGENKVYFDGAQARKQYGGKRVPIFFAHGNYTEKVAHGAFTHHCVKSSSQNITHYGHFSASEWEPDSVFFGLMAGVGLVNSSTEGKRTYVSALDAAILADLGVPLVPGVIR